MRLTTLLSAMLILGPGGSALAQQASEHPLPRPAPGVEAPVPAETMPAGSDASEAADAAPEPPIPNEAPPLPEAPLATEAPLPTEAPPATEVPLPAEEPLPEDADAAAAEPGVAQPEAPAELPMDEEYRAISDAFSARLGEIADELAAFDEAAVALHLVPDVTQADLDTLELQIKDLEDEAAADPERAEAAAAEIDALTGQHATMSEQFAARTRMQRQLAGYYDRLGDVLFDGAPPVPLPELAEPPSP